MTEKIIVQLAMRDIQLIAVSLAVQFHATSIHVHIGHRHGDWPSGAGPCVCPPCVHGPRMNDFIVGWERANYYTTYISRPTRPIQNIQYMPIGLDIYNFGSSANGPHRGI